MKRETRLKTTALSREIKELTKTINEMVRKRASLRHDHRKLLDSDKEHQVRVLSRRLEEAKRHVINNEIGGSSANSVYWLQEVSRLESKISELKADIAIEEALK